MKNILNVEEINVLAEFAACVVLFQSSSRQRGEKQRWQNT